MAQISNQENSNHSANQIADIQDQQIHIVLPISTELQRMLLDNTKATVFALINGDALVNQDGTINSDVLDLDALRNALAHAPRGEGGVFFSAVYKGGVPRTAVDTVNLLLKGFASHYAGISNVNVTNHFSNGE